MTATDLDLTEKGWDTQLFNSRDGVATMLGWTLVYHTLRSKGSQTGFPDRVLVRDRVVYAELKRQQGTPTDAQMRWLTGLAVAGAEAYLWRPTDLDEIGRILAGRWSIDSRSYHVPVLVGRDGGDPATSRAHWRPNSLWTPEGTRVDGGR